MVFLRSIFRLVGQAMLILLTLPATEDIYWVANPFYVPEPATVIQLCLAAIMLGLAGIRRFHSSNVAAQQVVMCYVRRST
jgi:hypothetical protein